MLQQKRKACQSCTRSKAKCSPAQDGGEVCYRCKRLKKECVYDETVRKRGPKPRSRLQQLEQRVDTLIDLIAVNQPPAKATPAYFDPAPRKDTANAPTASREGSNAPPSCTDAADTPDDHLRDEESPKYYDPVEAGLIDHELAGKLLNTFRRSCVLSFPFVVVPQSTDSETLRRRQPFLFLAIMTVCAHADPEIQRRLDKEFRREMASRVITEFDKSLEVLQGLLVYGAWYHHLFEPHKHQLGAVVQLCVAMVQEMGFSKSLKNKAGERGEKTNAEKRAYLGTYFLTVAFSHGYRKRSTMTHTKFMAQCYQSLARTPEYVTDELIPPLIQLSDLMTKVGDYFCYEDVDNADIQGEMLVEMATNNFHKELERIKATIPDNHMLNRSVTLHCIMVEIWIYECSLHGDLWETETQDPESSLPPCRLRMLHRIMSSMKTYLNTLLEIPVACLPHLSFCAWSGWFYANNVACKLVFLQDVDYRGQVPMEPIAQAIGNMMEAPPESTTMPGQTKPNISWDPVVVAQEAQIDQIFQEFIDRLTATSSEGANPGPKDCRTTLCRFAFLQNGIRNAVNKRLDDYISRQGRQPLPDFATHSQMTENVPVSQTSVYPHSHMPVASSGASYVQEQIQSHRIPLMDAMHFDTMNFDSVQPPEPVMVQQEFDEWAWNLMMTTDFTMPPM